MLPHPLTASVVEIVDGAASLWFTGGCFESPQRQTGLSVDNTKVELATALFRAKDRLTGGFESAPADDELTDRQRTVWDTYAEARTAALGYPVRVQRRRYVFRLYGGFNDVADTEFDRLWAGGTLDWSAPLIPACMAGLAGCNGGHVVVISVHFRRGFTLFEMPCQ